MCTDFATAIQQEIADLEADLSRNPIYRKIKALNGALREYQSTESPQRSVANSLATGTAAMGAARTNGSASAQRQQVLDGVFEYIKEKMEPTPTKILYSLLTDAGVKIGGKMPINSISAILSRDDRFMARGRQGWLLKTNDPLKDLNIDLGLGGEATVDENDD